MAKRGSTHRLMRWLWTSRRMDARLARLALLPAAGLWRAGTTVRNGAYARGWLRQDPLPLPSIGLGNLTVGGSGKLPVMTWMARHLVAQGKTPGVVLSGMTAKAQVSPFQHAVPSALVTAAADPVQGGARLAAEGARILLADCSIPPQGIRPDCVIAVIGAETSRAVRWSVPAGPWRQAWSALESADAVVVTRKRASREAADALAADLHAATGLPIAIVHLGVRHFEGLVSGAEHSASALRGCRVVAASGSADPDSFVSQVKGTGAAVQVARWEADGELRDLDVAWLAHAARRADFVVISEADAVKLRGRWPARVAEPLVAVLDLTWESNAEALMAVMDSVQVAR